MSTETDELIDEQPWVSMALNTFSLLERKAAMKAFLIAHGVEPDLRINTDRAWMEGYAVRTFEFPVKPGELFASATQEPFMYVAWSANGKNLRFWSRSKAKAKRFQDKTNTSCVELYISPQALEVA